MGKKGVLHAVEGIIAALVILSFMGGAFHPPLSAEDWRDAVLRQETDEFVEAMDRAELAELAVRGEASLLADIARDSAFLGTGVGVAFRTIGLAPPVIHVGIVVNSSGGGNETYDRYFRMLAEDAAMQKHEFELNSREIRLAVSNTSLAELRVMSESAAVNRSKYKYDVLVVPVENNLTLADVSSGLDVLEDFVYLGGGIIQVSNLSSESDVSSYHSLQGGLFGLEWVGVSTAPSGNAAFSPIRPEEPSRSIKKTFHAMSRALNFDGIAGMNHSDDKSKSLSTVYAGDSGLILGYADCLCNIENGYSSNCSSVCAEPYNYSHPGVINSTTGNYRYGAASLAGEEHDFLVIDSGGPGVPSFTYQDDEQTSTCDEATIGCGCAEYKNATWRFFYPHDVTDVTDVRVVLDVVDEDTGESGFYFNGNFIGTISEIANGWTGSEYIGLLTIDVPADKLVPGENLVEIYNYPAGPCWVRYDSMRAEVYTTASGGYDELFIDADDNMDFFRHSLTGGLQSTCDEDTIGCGCAVYTNASWVFSYPLNPVKAQAARIVLNAFDEDAGESGVYFNGNFVGDIDDIADISSKIKAGSCNWVNCLITIDLPLKWLRQGDNEVEIYNYPGSVCWVRYDWARFEVDSTDGARTNDKIVVDNNSYIVDGFGPQGRYVKLLPLEPHNFSGLNTGNYIWTAHGLEDYTRENVSRYVVVDQPGRLSNGARPPAAIVNYGGFTGRTVWMNNNLESEDDWHLLRSLILFAARDVYDYSFVPQAAATVATTNKLFMLSKDVLEPYILQLRTWYRV